MPKDSIVMNIRKHVLALLAWVLIGCAGISASQYLTDRDRKEIGNLSNIPLPRDAVELKRVRSFPTAEQEASGVYFVIPGSMAMDSSGILHITDVRANAIHKFDLQGNYQGRIGGPGQGPGELSMPSKIFADDDGVIVQEWMNRRLQFFDSEGKHKHSIRLFKDYSDVELTKDGHIIGAVAMVASYQSDTLLDVLAQDGKLMRSFGSPVDFKYDRSTLNSRKIFLARDNTIIQVFEYLPIIQKYSLDGRLLEEKKLETKFSLLKEKLNRRFNSYRPNEVVGYIRLFSPTTYFENCLYILDYVRPRIWIWEITADFEIKRVFWTNVETKCYVRFLNVYKEENRLVFQLCGQIEDDVEKIHIFIDK